MVGELILSTGERQNAELSPGEGAEKYRYVCLFSPLHATTGGINVVYVLFHDTPKEKWVIICEHTERKDP